MSLQETTEFIVEDREALRRAVKSLEHPSLAGRLANIAGKPLELIGYALPSSASKAISSATSKGLEAALKVALRTLPSSPRTNSQMLHRALVTASGGAGGTFGLAALPVELPVSLCDASSDCMGKGGFVHNMSLSPDSFERRRQKNLPATGRQGSPPRLSRVTHRSRFFTE